MDMHQVAQRIQDQVDAGKMTYDAGLKLLHEAHAASVNGQVPADLVETPKPDPRKAAPISLSDRELIVSALRATGQTEVEALRTAIATDVGTQAQIITAERNRLQNLADRKASDGYDRTPAGKLERGEALAAERAAEDKLLAPAEELLREMGLDDDSIQGLSKEERLVMAGLKEAPVVRRETNSRMVNEGLDETTRAIGAELADAKSQGGSDA